MAKADSSINARTAPDQVLLDIADYVLDYKVADERSFDTARLCVTDSLACAFEALTKAYEIQGCIAIENDFFSPRQRPQPAGTRGDDCGVDA